MSSEGSIDSIAADVATRVREALAEAERRASELVTGAERRAREIVTEAEAEAERIRAQADQARQRVEEARRALAGLEAATDAPPAPTTAPEEVATEAVPEPVVPAESPADEAERTAHEPDTGRSGPTTEELIAQLTSGGSATPSGPGSETGGEHGDTDAAARLVAMNMALDGATREEVDRHLADSYPAADRDALVDEVFSRIGKQ